MFIESGALEGNWFFAKKPILVQDYWILSGPYQWKMHEPHSHVWQ